jgi:hypothetical protein
MQAFRQHEVCTEVQHTSHLQKTKQHCNNARKWFSIVSWFHTQTGYGHQSLTIFGHMIKWNSGVHASKNCLPLYAIYRLKIKSRNSWK